MMLFQIVSARRRGGAIAPLNCPCIMPRGGGYASLPRMMLTVGLVLLLCLSLCRSEANSGNDDNDDGAIEVPPFSYFVPPEEIGDHPALNAILYYQDLLWAADPICVDPPCEQNVNDEEERYLLNGYLDETLPSAGPNVLSSSASPSSSGYKPPASRPLLSASAAPSQEPEASKALPSQAPSYLVESQPPPRPEPAGHRGKPTSLDDEAMLAEVIINSDYDNDTVYTLTTDIVLRRSLPSIRFMSHLTIQGACNRTGGQCIIDGGGRFPIFTDGARIGCWLTVSNIIFQNSHGAVFQGGCRFDAVNCAFRDNVGYIVGTSPGGGALQFESGSPAFNITGCEFSNNSAVKADGGAISYRGTDGGVVTNTVFINNRAALTGGAIFLQSPDTFICNNCSFIGNSAGSMGGGFSLFRYTSPATLIRLIGGLFEGNKVVKGAGGGVVVGAPIDAKSCNVKYTGNAAAMGADVVVNLQPVEGVARFAFCPEAPTGAVVTDIVGDVTSPALTRSTISNAAAVGADVVVNLQPVEGVARFAFCPEALTGAVVTDIVRDVTSPALTRSTISSNCTGCPALSAVQV
ncbi:hypothetical protein CBR_g10807 [Chara braunii]|uniref:Right handed beta helix domain-containing protein n=1 Tax=Chara braunii TaxID=69332 RepID=A0A388KP92_CHABU|nr:hypothetical protein CBR_g10807 [Chara braunii]|eukprot:GBG71871.1 hypothetical protein CBR_g10807 [Chara braunii]